MYKILFLTPNLSSGGAERQMVNLARLLKKRGLHVEVLCYSKGDFYSSLLKEDDILIHWKIFKNYFLRLIGVRRFIRRGKYDCVISFLEVANFLNNFSAIGGKTWKVITGERSSKTSTFYSKRGKVFGWFQRYSDIIVCNSHNAKEMWEKYSPQYKDKLSVIHNPVILPEIISKYTPKQDGKLHIVVAASYQYLKNPIGLIKALVLMTEKEKDRIEINWYGKTDVSLYGDKPYQESIEMIQQNKLENVIRLFDRTKDIHNKMNEADIVALFSELEGFPNAICEGMMIGKPIIMTRVSDYNILVDESNGYLCDWDSPESIKHALVTASELNIKELLNKGENSKIKAENLFVNKTIINKWIELI
jgi:glycosyltransferase involved in cell wall biosynthesis